MSESKYDEVVRRISREYILLRKGSIWYFAGGALAFLLATGIISYSVWIATLKKAEAKRILVALNSSKVKAERDVATIDRLKAKHEEPAFVYQGRATMPNGRTEPVNLRVVLEKDVVSTDGGVRTINISRSGLYMLSINLLQSFKNSEDSTIHDYKTCGFSLYKKDEKSHRLLSQSSFDVGCNVSGLVRLKAGDRLTVFYGQASGKSESASIRAAGYFVQS